MTRQVNSCDQNVTYQNNMLVMKYLVFTDIKRWHF